LFQGKEPQNASRWRERYEKMIISSTENIHIYPNIAKYVKLLKNIFESSFIFVKMTTDSKTDKTGGKQGNMIH